MDEIAATAPDLIGLQEVSLLRTQTPGNSLAADGSGIEWKGTSPDGPLFSFKADAADVQFDYLELLLDARLGALPKGHHGDDRRHQTVGIQPCCHQNGTNPG